MLLWVLNCSCGAPARSIVKDDGRDGVLEVETQRADVYLEGNIYCGGGICLNDTSLDPEKKRGRLARTYEELIKSPFGASELMEFAAACKTWVAVEVQDLLSFAVIDWATRERIANEIRHEVHATDDMFEPLYIVDAADLLARLARDRLRLERADGGSWRWLRGRWRRRTVREKKSKMATLRKPTVVPRGVRSSRDLSDYQHCERIRRLQRRKPPSLTAAAKRRVAKRRAGRSNEWSCRRTPVSAKEFTLRKLVVRKGKRKAKPVVRKDKPALSLRCARCVKEKKPAALCKHQPKPNELLHAVTSDGTWLPPKSFRLKDNRKKSCANSPDYSEETWHSDDSL